MTVSVVDSTACNKPKMPDKRYNELMYEGGSLTDKEMQEGWHFCNEWDGLLIGRDCPEFDCCTCFEGRKNEKVTSKFLNDHKACMFSVTRFRATFPEGAELTLQNCIKAIRVHLHVRWFLYNAYGRQAEIDFSDKRFAFCFRIGWWKYCPTSWWEEMYHRVMGGYLYAVIQEQEAKKELT